MTDPLPQQTADFRMACATVSTWCFTPCCFSQQPGLTLLALNQSMLLHTSTAYRLGKSPSGDIKHLNHLNINEFRPQSILFRTWGRPHSPCSLAIQSVSTVQ